VQEFHPDDTINNRYKIIRKLGAGAMGSVYLCEDLVENNIKVALKILVSENLDEQDVWAKGEYEALTRLRHPNLARVYNFGKIGDTKDYFIVSEFVKGVDLYTATEYAHYDDLNDIMVQICRALEYIHSQGYVHFDIKPDNILVTRHKTLGLKDGSKLQYTDEEYSAQNRSVFSKPNVKLIDFGLAEKITGSFNFAIKGTLNYLAPEIINGATPDKRADLYSLGVTLYQITNRDLPFYQDPSLTNVIRGQKRSDLFESHMKKQPEYLRNLIMKLLEEKPEDRFQSAKEVIQALNRTSGQHYDVETKETQVSYLYCPKLVGRKKELSFLKDLYERIFFPHRYKVLESSLPAASREGEVPAQGEAVEEERIDLPAAPAPSGQEAPAQPQAAAGGTGAPDADGKKEAPPPAKAAGSGDDDDLERLAAAPRDARAPSVPPLVIIEGEMGVGKSRLLEEFHHFLKLNDLNLYIGNCYEGKSKAYQPFVEILRCMVFDLGLESEIYGKYQADILKLLPELTGKEGRPKDPGGRAYQEKIFFIDRISQFFIEAAERTPFVITINNLHWGDEVTVELLGVLVDRLCELDAQGSPVKIMILISQRTDEPVVDVLKTLIDRMKGSGRCQDIHLRRLKRAHLVEILQTILNLNEIPAPFLDRLEEKTGGNPLLLMETLKVLQDEGILKNTGTGWTIRAVNYNRVEIPPSLEELLLKRVRRLEPVKREILEVISVLNKPIAPKVLQKFERFAGMPILVHLRDLESAGLVSKVFESGKLQFQIDQPKMREIIYESLDPDLSRRYHGEVGDVLSELYRGREEEVLEELAYHYQKSDRTDRALDLAVQAGDRLKAIYANDRALEYYIYIIEKIEDDPARISLWIETHEKLGDLCTTMGKYEIAEQSYGSLLDPDIRAHLDVEGISRAYRKMGKVFEIQGDYDNALKCYKDARNFLAQANPNAIDERIRVFNSIGWTYVCMGKYEKAMAISLEGLRVIEGAQEKIEHAMIFNTIGSANYYKGNIGQAIEYHSRSLQIRENLENIPEVINSLNNLGSAYLANAEYGEAVEHFRKALATSEEIGDPYGRAMTLFHYARADFAVGQDAQAEEHLRESLRLSKNYNMRFLNIQNYILLGMILRSRKDSAKAEGNLFRALTAFSKQGNRWGLCTVLLELIEVHRQRGTFSEAKAVAEEALRYAVDLDIDYLKALSLLAKARILRDSDEKALEPALEILKEALAATTKVENPEVSGEIASEMGEVLVRLRRLHEAREQFRAAEEKFRAVLDRLPKEFRASYQEKHKDKFRKTESFLLAQEVPGQAAPSEAPARVPAEDPLRCVSEMMALLGSLPPLKDYLDRLLDHLIRYSGAKTAFVLEKKGDRLRPVVAAAPPGQPRPAAAGSIRLVAIQESLAQKSSVLTDAFGVFPYMTPKRTEGVVYLEKPARVDAGSMVVYQSFLNLVPLAFLTLPDAPPAPAAIEVQPVEIGEK
jgi:serine/threonine protein kinase/tetratricopeptide (TPR) repeat protein